MSTWSVKVRERYQMELVSGLHDPDCEFRTEGFYLCHCSKRRREARGFITPPIDDLEFPPPSCPVRSCDKDLEHDGDGWRCYDCNLSWDSDGRGYSARFTDEYSEDLAAEVARWEERRMQEQR